MPPLTLMIKPASGLCNLRCSYCFYSDVTRHREIANYGIMSADTLETVMRRAFAYAEGALTLSFQGGEPTLAGKDFYRRLLEIEKSYVSRSVRISHTIQTNGVQLDEEWADIFRQGRFLVGVSLDGTQALHDRCRRDAEGRPTCQRIHDSLRLLRNAGVEYNVLCVVHRYIAEHPVEVVNALRPHRYLQFIPCLNGLDGETSDLSLTPQAYAHFLIETFALYENAWKTGNPLSIRNFDNWLSMLLGQEPENCAMAGRCGDYFLLEADGSVYPCDFYVLDRWRLGNICDTSFFRLATSPLRQTFREESEKIAAECLSCPWYNLCRGGCKREREPFGQMYAKTRWCESHRLFFETCAGRMEKMALAVAQTYQRPSRSGKR